MGRRMLSHSHVCNLANELFGTETDLLQVVELLLQVFLFRVDLGERRLHLVH